jgi:hypothetical protein
MRPVRTIVAVLFAAAIAVTGCTAHTSTDQPTPAPDPTPVDRQAPIYAAVLRQYLTSDAGFGGHRFPQGLCRTAWWPTLALQATVRREVDRSRPPSSVRSATP